MECRILPLYVDPLPPCARYEATESYHHQIFRGLFQICFLFHLLIKSFPYHPCCQSRQAVYGLGAQFSNPSLLSKALQIHTQVPLNSVALKHRHKCFAGLGLECTQKPSYPLTFRSGPTKLGLRHFGMAVWGEPCLGAVLVASILWINGTHWSPGLGMCRTFVFKVYEICPAQFLI